MNKGFEFKKEYFNENISKADTHLRNLLSVRPLYPSEILSRKELPRCSGVYLFSEKVEFEEKFLYVGQSKNVFHRLSEHCGKKNIEMANFAYHMTVASTKLRPISGSPNSTKKSMYRIPEFVTGLEKSLSKIESMNYRWLEVDGKLEKTLLEIYAAVILESTYNSFD